MKKQFFIVMFTLLLTLLLTIPSYAGINVIDRLEQHSVELIAMFSNNYDDAEYSCSGVVVGEKDNISYVLTAKHCVKNEQYTLSGIIIDSNWAVKIIASKDYDLALILITPTLNKLPVKLAKAVAWQEEVQYFGYPPELMYYKSGRVIIRRNKLLYLNFEIISGCSGGGVYNMDFELVGIGVGGSTQLKMSSAVPINSIKEFLNKAVKEIQSNDSYSEVYYPIMSAVCR